MPRRPSSACLSHCGEAARRQDRDRFLTCLFAPPDRREALFAILAFNIEIARTREVVREPMMGRIRLQWWREAVDCLFQSGGTVPRHQALPPLAEAIECFNLSRRYFDTLIDARESDLDDTAPATMTDLLTYAEETTAPLLWLALEVLGASDDTTIEAGRHLGIAWALTGLLRAVPFHLRQRRVMLPADLLRHHGLNAARLADQRPEPQTLAAVVVEVAATAREHLAAVRRATPLIPLAAMPVLLLTTLTELHLGVIDRNKGNVFAPQLQMRHPLWPIILWWRASRGKF
ncbi:MAG: phytoene/squalene synthase family protein [Rhodospirillaceae bacterium]